MEMVNRLLVPFVDLERGLFRVRTRQGRPMAHVKKRIAAALVGTVVTVGLAMTSTAVASAAPIRPAIDEVPCGPSDYLQVWWHAGNDSPRSEETCLANAGTETFSCAPNGGDCW